LGELPCHDTGGSRKVDIAGVNASGATKAREEGVCRPPAILARPQCHCAAGGVPPASAPMSTSGGLDARLPQAHAARNGRNLGGQRQRTPGYQNAPADRGLKAAMPMKARMNGGGRRRPRGCRHRARGWRQWQAAPGVVNGLCVMNIIDIAANLLHVARNPAGSTACSPPQRSR
jgi:hypothetical protein